MRGDAGVDAQAAVIVSVQKQPGVDTIALTKKVEEALAEIEHGLPGGVELNLLFQQARFIDAAIANVEGAIRDGAIMVVIVLFLFLLNVRTTLITLTAIPLSFVATAIFFRFADISINTMTLGGLAVAIGMVVDDAIVDVENVYRRLRENLQLSSPRPVLRVIADASAEVRNSILYATLLIILVFVPLFGLAGIEGRLFAPIGVATIVAMTASFIVSLTVIPALCSYLLPRMKRMDTEEDGWVVRHLKDLDRRFLLGPALEHPLVALWLAGLLVVGSFSLYPVMGKEFLPEFNEGTATINVLVAPGTSLEESKPDRNDRGAAAALRPGDREHRTPDRTRRARRTRRGGPLLGDRRRSPALRAIPRGDPRRHPRKALADTGDCAQRRSADLTSARPHALGRAGTGCREALRRRSRPAAR